MQSETLFSLDISYFVMVFSVQFSMFFFFYKIVPVDGLEQDADFHVCASIILHVIQWMVPVTVHIRDTLDRTVKKVPDIKRKCINVGLLTYYLV
jgi:hypothetical protein